VVDVDAVLAELYELVASHLTEKQRRLLAGAGARALGRGGGARMARISGLSRPTVYAGVRELEERPDPGGRVRRRGGGPKRRTTSDPGLLAALDALVDPDTRGDPDSPLRWTCKSTRELAEALTAQGHRVSDDTVGRLLKQQGYTLQRTQKTLEGAQHPDRDGQFRSVNEQARSHLAAGQPVVSVDTKKKELVGRYANGGAEWQPAGEPERVGVHDFPDPTLGKAIPLGSTTWAPTLAGSAWEPTTTRRRLQWRRCGAGGSRSAGLAIPRPNGCWSPSMPVGPTATGSGPGRPSWPGSRPRRA
jgi:transposase